MKLSESILLGSVNNGQAFGVLKDGDGNTCAMGAAMVGSGLEASIDSWGPIQDKFPILKKEMDLPNNLEWPDFMVYQEHNLWNVIAILNNEHKWTRPQIAQWVAELEQQMEAGVEQVETKVAVQC